MAKLIRQRDNLVKEGLIEFIEWDKNDRGKTIHIKPKVGFSCIVRRRQLRKMWLTTEIVEVISDTEFKTKNSHYKIEN